VVWDRNARPTDQKYSPPKPPIGAEHAAPIHLPDNLNEFFANLDRQVASFTFAQKKPYDTFEVDGTEFGEIRRKFHVQLVKNQRANIHRALTQLASYTFPPSSTGFFFIKGLSISLAQRIRELQTAVQNTDQFRRYVRELTKLHNLEEGDQPKTTHPDRYDRTNVGCKYTCLNLYLQIFSEANFYFKHTVHSYYMDWHALKAGNICIYYSAGIFSNQDWTTTRRDHDSARHNANDDIVTVMDEAFARANALAQAQYEEARSSPSFGLAHLQPYGLHGTVAAHLEGALLTFINRDEYEFVLQHLNNRRASRGEPLIPRGFRIQNVLNGQTGSQKLQQTLLLQTKHSSPTIFDGIHNTTGLLPNTDFPEPFAITSMAPDNEPAKSTPSTSPALFPEGNSTTNTPGRTYNSHKRFLQRFFIFR